MSLPLIAAAGVAVGAAALYAARKRSELASILRPEAARTIRQQNAPYLIQEGRFVRGIQKNRVTQGGEVTPHWGLDLAAPEGTPVYAAKTGIVIRAEPINGYGNAVIIKHNDGNESTLYGHLLAYSVKQGDVVEGGQQIAKVGRSTAGPSGVAPSWGATMASHLHFEVHPRAEPVLGRNVERRDPVRWLADQGINQYNQTWSRT